MIDDNILKHYRIVRCNMKLEKNSEFTQKKKNKLIYV
jgi:hypothetical protein